MKNIGIVQFQRAPYRDAAFWKVANTPGFDLTVGLFPISFDTHPEWRYSGSGLHEIIGMAIDDFLQLKSWDAVSICGYSEPTARAALKYCFSHEVPVVLQADTVEKGHLSFLKKRFYKRVDAFWVPGNRARQYFLSMGVPDEKIFRGSYTYDYEEIRSVVRAIDRASARQSLGIEKDDYALLFIGKLIPSRRVDILINSFSRISTPSLKLIVIGDGEDSPLVRQAVCQDSRICWIPSVPLSDLYNYYAAADCYVHPGKEPFSCAVMQAVASGIPVIASDAVGATSDFLLDGINGCCIEFGDANSLTAAIRTAFSNSASLAVGAKETQERVCAELGTEFAAEQLIAACEYASLHLRQ